jgi:hypothetical protein
MPCIHPRQVLASNGLSGGSVAAAVLLDLYTQHAGTLIAHMEATGTAVYRSILNIAAHMPTYSTLF